MRYLTTAAFDECMRGAPEDKKKRLKKAIRLAVAFFETGDLPHGLGFKSLGRQVWEIRAGLSDRVLFRRDGNTIEFLLAGSHDDIRRFLKNI